MSDDMNVGKLKISCYEGTQIEWEITDFFTKFEFNDPNTYRNNPARASGCPQTQEISLSSPMFIYSENKCILSISKRPSITQLRLLILDSGEFKEQFECELGLKKVDGDVEIFQPRQPSSVFQLFGSKLIRIINISEIFNSRNELAPLNIVTIMCTLKRNIAQTAQVSLLCEQPPLKLMKIDTLSENFKSLFADKNGCDVILQVKEKEFHAHKTVLMARSSVFAPMFLHDTSENQTGIVNIPDCDPDSFHVFLEYLYCGKLEDFSFHSAFNLYSTSEKYNVQELKSFCVEYMEQSLTVDNVCDVLILAELYDETKLFSTAQHFFTKYADKVTETTQWESLMENNYQLANKLIKAMISKIKTKDRYIFN